MPSDSAREKPEYAEADGGIPFWSQGVTAKAKKKKEEKRREAQRAGRTDIVLSKVLV